MTGTLVADEWADFTLWEMELLLPADDENERGNDEPQLRD